MESVAANSCPASYALRCLPAANDRDDNTPPSAASSLAFETTKHNHNVPRLITRGSAVAEGPRDARASFEILSGLMLGYTPLIYVKYVVESRPHCRTRL